MSAQLIYSRWVRLGTALVASALVDLWIDRWALLKSPPPSSRLLDWLLAPGVYLALWMYPLHADPAALTIVWIVTTLILTAILYALLSLVVWIVDRGRRSAYDDRKTA